MVRVGKGGKACVSQRFALYERRSSGRGGGEWFHMCQEMDKGCCTTGNRRRRWIKDGISLEVA